MCVSLDCLKIMFQEKGGSLLHMWGNSARRKKVSVWNLRAGLVSRSFSVIGVLGKRSLQVRSRRERWCAWRGQCRRMWWVSSMVLQWGHKLELERFCRNLDALE